MNGYILAVAALFEQAGGVSASIADGERANLHLGAILDDPDFAHGLANARLMPGDVSSMSDHSWIRYLHWRAGRAGAPAHDFLDTLYAVADGQLTRSGIVSAILAVEPSHDGITFTGESWFDRQFRPMTLPRDLPTHDNAVTRNGVDIAQHLLDIGTPESLSAFRQLYQYAAAWRPQLSRLVADELSGLDPTDAGRADYLAELRLIDEEPPPNGPADDQRSGDEP
jgi:hypothetical protein